MATAPPMPKSFEDARLRHIEIEAELEKICSAVHFRTSKRACEFLRYVVRVALDGRVDSLKERSIGIDLLGRDVSYDPSSDAIVRVRANDVRKRLSSYYASAEGISAIQINLPTGTYIPHFVPNSPSQEKIDVLSPEEAMAIAGESASPVLPMSRFVLMRPALLALLVCVLLMRHQLEDRDSYLRFWDQILSGRNTLRLSIAPQDQSKLASSLYPITWIAGRYGVDTAIEDNSTFEGKSDQLAFVQESFVTPLSMTNDGRLRWVMSEQAGLNHIVDRRAVGTASVPAHLSAALLTILPEDFTTLHIQGTDNEAINRLLQNLTSNKYFPDEVADQLSSRHVLQVLLLRGDSGQWQTQIFSGNL